MVLGIDKGSTSDLLMIRFEVVVIYNLDNGQILLSFCNNYIDCVECYFSVEHMTHQVTKSQYLDMWHRELLN